MENHFIQWNKKLFIYLGANRTAPKRPPKIQSGSLVWKASTHFTVTSPKCETVEWDNLIKFPTIPLINRYTYLAYL